MALSILHLNIFQGKYLDEILTKVSNEKYDLLHFQEVVGGRLSLGGRYVYPFKRHKETAKDIAGDKRIAGKDIFEEIKSRTPYEGILAKGMELRNDPHSYFGNATFHNPEMLSVEKTEIIEMHEKTIHDSLEFDARYVGRNAIAVLFKAATGKRFWSINAHFAWGPSPKDTAYKVKAAEKLANFIKKLNEPFIFTGDFNVTQETRTASLFEKFGTNHAKEHRVTNTLNEKIHPARHLFPPGLAVDYIFTKNLETSHFKLIREPILSDHYGLSIDIKT